MKKLISQKTIALCFGILVICFAVGFYVIAWTEPTAVPPGGNVAAPINVGLISQVKQGALGVGGVFRAFSNAIFDGNVGIGTTAPGARLDVQGDIKVGGVTIRGDGSVSPGLNAELLDGRRAGDLVGIRTSYRMSAVGHVVGTTAHGRTVSWTCPGGSAPVDVTWTHREPLWHGHQACNYTILGSTITLTSQIRKTIESCIAAGCSINRLLTMTCVHGQTLTHCPGCHWCWVGNSCAISTCALRFGCGLEILVP